jgi:hypothetical protein
MIVATEIIFAVLALLCWLIAAFLFAPWRRGFLESHFSNEVKAHINTEGVRAACLFAAIASLCSALAASFQVLDLFRF